MPQPTTILFVAGADFFSGAERALLTTVKGLDPSRYRPVVAAGTPGEFLQQLRDAGIEAEHVPLVRSDWRRPLAWGSSVWSLFSLARRHKARLVHSNEAPSFQPAGYAARWLGIPAITHFRFPEAAAGYEWYFKPGCRRALFVSEYLRSYAVQEAPALLASKSDVLYDGVEFPALPDRAAWLEGRRALDLPPEVPAVVIAGQVVEIKGIWEYIEAARLLVAKGVRATFAVLGDDLKNNGATRVAAERRVAELGLQEHVRFLGFRPDAPRLIPLFNLVAVPSHVEPLGNATLEAMAAGRPVVGARVGGIPEMIVDGTTGTLVPTKDAPALAAGLEALIASPERREAFGRAGHARAIECFSVPVHITRLQKMYDEILARPPATKNGQS